MTTQAYLNYILRFDRMITNKKLEIENIESKATNMVVSYDKDNVKSSGSQDKMANLAIQAVEKDKLVDKYEKQRAVIVKQIDDIEDCNSYEILTMYYVLDADLQEIADTLGYSLSHTKRLKAKAIDQFENKYLSCYRHLKVADLLK